MPCKWSAKKREIHFSFSIPFSVRRLSSGGLGRKAHSVIHGSKRRDTNAGLTPTRPSTGSNSQRAVVKLSSPQHRIRFCWKGHTSANTTRHASTLQSLCSCHVWSGRICPLCSTWESSFDALTRRLTQHFAQGEEGSKGHKGGTKAEDVKLEGAELLEAIKKQVDFPALCWLRTRAFVVVTLRFRRWSTTFPRRI